jgi:glycosyltransferase involved in cell wall biosynthesis
MPVVTVIIPTYNRSAVVTQAIDSVLSQTYRDYEIVVVDDGSTDDTPETLTKYAGSIRYHRQDNRGASAAQNKGVELARGDWISILASDDVWLPRKLEKQVEAFARFGGDFGACFTNCTFDGDPTLNLSAFELAGLRTQAEFAPLWDAVGFILSSHPIIFVQSLMVSRALVEDLGGFDERLVVSEDTDLLFRMAFRTRFCFVNEPLVKIDRTPGRKVGLMELFSTNDDRMFRSREHMFRKWLSSPEMTDATTRAEIRGTLRRLYYSWVIANLYRFKLSDAFNISRQIMSDGDSIHTFVRTMGRRALHKALTLLWHTR